MPTMDTNEDAVVACVDLVDRCGATDFDVGYLHDDVPIEDAAWWAKAQFRGARIMVENHQSPVQACQALAERLLRGATCRCGQVVALSDGRPGCRWRLVGPKWKPGCDAPPLKIKGQRGDHAAMAAALNESANLAERRKKKC